MPTSQTDYGARPIERVEMCPRCKRIVELEAGDVALNQLDN